MNIKIFSLIIFFVVVFLFYPTFGTFFSQDDFFHFKVSLTDGSFKSFLNFFGFHPFEERGIAFYRPLFREVLYHSYYNIFGLNHIPFRILSFALHFINIVLVYLFINRLFQNRFIAYFTTFFFAICATNTATLYYLAGGIQAQGATMFILLTMLIYSKFLISQKWIYYVLSIITFIASLMSHELASITPVLLLGLALIYISKKLLFKKLLLLLPHFLLLFVYLFLNMTIIGFSESEKQYQISLSLKSILNSYMWYFGWALGLPEMLIDFVNPGFKLNPNLLMYWKNNYLIIFPSFFIAIGTITLSIIYLLKNNFKKFLDKKFLFLCGWFILGLSPVILLPSHKSNYYLATSLPAFWAVIGWIVFSTYKKINNRSLNKAYLILIIASLITLSSASIYLGRTTFWAATRGKIAYSLINQIKTSDPTLPKGAIIYIKNDLSYPFVAMDWGGTSKQAKIALNDQDALQLYYQDESLKVIYEDSLAGSSISGQERIIIASY